MTCIYEFGFSASSNRQTSKYDTNDQTTLITLELGWLSRASLASRVRLLVKRSSTSSQHSMLEQRSNYLFAERERFPAKCALVSFAARMWIFTIWLSFFGFALLEKRRREGKKTWPNHHNGTSIVGIWFSHLPTSKMGAGNFIRNGGFTYDWYDLNQLNSLIERWVACTYHVTGGGSPVRERNCRYTRLPNVSAFTRIRECWICKRNEKISAFYSVGVTYSATTSFTGYSYAWFVWHNLAHDIIFISVAYAITLHSIHFVTVDARPVAWWLPLPPLHWKQTFKFQSVTAPSAWYWSHMHLENEGKEDTEMRCLPLLLWLKKQKTRGDRNAYSTEGRSDRMQSTKFKFFRILPKSSSRSRECRQHELSFHLMLSLECAFAVCLDAAEHLKWSNISNEISFEWDD